MFNTLNNILFGVGGGLSKRKFRKLTERSKFSDFLPYVAYGEEEGVYLNIDESCGFIWECVPLVYAGTNTFNVLEGLFSAGFPEDTVLQFILYADPHVDHILDLYSGVKVNRSDLINTATQSVSELFRDGTHGLDKLSGNVIRNFRLFVALRVPAEKIKNSKQLLNYRENISEILKGARLKPRLLQPQELIDWLSRFFNGYKPANNKYDDRFPIRKQIILPESRIRSNWSDIRIGERVLQCTTAKKLPVEVNELTSNILTGDIWGVRSDNNQIQTPFLFTLNYIFENLRPTLHAKCNFVLQQKAVGSLAPSLVRKQEEYTWAAGECERGTPFVRMMPIFWHISEDETESAETAARVKRIWESSGFMVQEDRGILNVLLLAALPMGLYTAQKNVEFIDRDIIVNGSAACKFLPIQSDFNGIGNPVDLYVGRKGQIAGLDIFDREAINHNALIAANSGSGKSFFMNQMLLNQYSAGTWIRIIDIGGSYEKLSNIVGGKVITFSKNSSIILNPFSNIREIEEDQNVISAIVSQMIYSSTSERPTEIQMTLIKEAIRKTYDTYGNDGQLDHVHHFLYHWQDSTGETIDKMTAVARELAFNLKDFTSKGVYGKWFAGKSNLDISKDQFVVLELEDLTAQTELFRVVILQLINYITDNLYRGKRDIKKMVVFDESWQFLGKSGDADSSMMESVIEGGYRRARKYNGSFVTIFQSLLDIEKFGGVGRVINANSAFRFLMASGDYPTARSKGIIDYDPFIMEILKSISTPKPRYSEIFMDTPLGVGVARLVVDPVSYWMFTSDASDNAQINHLKEKGLDYAEIFKTLAN